MILGIYPNVTPRLQQRNNKPVCISKPNITFGMNKTVSVIHVLESLTGEFLCCKVNDRDNFFKIILGLENIKNEILFREKCLQQCGQKLSDKIKDEAIIKAVNKIKNFLQTNPTSEGKIKFARTILENLNETIEVDI